MKLTIRESNYKKQIESGELKRIHGLATDGRSKYFRLRNEGLSDFNAQYECFKIHYNIVKGV